MVPRTPTTQVLGLSAWASALHGCSQPLLGMSWSRRWGQQQPSTPWAAVKADAFMLVELEKSSRGLFSKALWRKAQEKKIKVSVPESSALFLRKNDAELRLNRYCSV